ncbi:unnamed protein product, partial [Scytosiphon promiscuus]
GRGAGAGGEEGHNQPSASSPPGKNGHPESSSLSAVGSVGRSLLEIFACGGGRRLGSVKEQQEEEEGKRAVPLPTAAAAAAAAAVDPADPLRGDLPLAREQRLKMAVAETGAVAASTVAIERRSSWAGRAAHAFAAASSGKPGLDDTSSGGSNNNSSGGTSSSFR